MAVAVSTAIESGRNSIVRAWAPVERERAILPYDAQPAAQSVPATRVDGLERWLLARWRNRRRRNRHVCSRRRCRRYRWQACLRRGAGRWR